MTEISLSKEAFCKYIRFIEKEMDFFNRIDDLCRHNRDVMNDTEVCPPASVDKMVELLEIIFGLQKDQFGYTTLSWWIYEDEFGKKDSDLTLEHLPEDHPYHKPDLTTPEKLYDFLLFERSCDEPFGFY